MLWWEYLLFYFFSLFCFLLIPSTLNAKPLNSKLRLSWRVWRLWCHVIAPTSIAGHARTPFPCAFFLSPPLIEGCGLILTPTPPDASQQHPLRSWERGGGGNQVANFIGDVVCPWGRGEPDGRELNLMWTQIQHGKPGQRGREPPDRGASMPRTWWTTGQQDQPNAYVANLSTA